MNEPLRGLVAAVFTPMHEDGSLHLEQVPVLVDHLEANNVQGLFVCGTTGESASLTTDERCAVAGAFVRAARGRLRAIIHVGHNALADARVLAAHAQEIGADAVGAAPPSYFRPGSVDVLIDCCAHIAAGAPRLPFYYYHIPVLTHVAFPMIEFLAQAGTRIPTLRGIKYTWEDLADYQQCLTWADGRYDILFGRDEMMLASLPVGARGWIGSTYNYDAPIYHRLREAYARGDLDAARTEQARAIASVGFLKRLRGVACGKVLMKFAGVDCGPPRLPNRRLSAAEEAGLRRELESLGYFDWHAASSCTATARV